MAPRGASLEFPTLIDIPMLAKLLGVGERYVRRMVAENQIEYIKVGHYVLSDLAVALRWLDCRRRTAAS